MNEINQLLQEDEFEISISEREDEINYLKNKIVECLEEGDHEFLVFLQKKN